MNDLFKEHCRCLVGEHGIFKFINEEDIKVLMLFFECKTKPAGEILWSEGDECGYVAFIVSGRVEIKKQHG